MERLSDKAIDIINELHTDRLDYTSEYLPLIDASDRLAAYEDTGLVPEEINTLQSYKLLDKHERGKLFEYQNLGCTIDRLRELDKADKDGQLVVPDDERIMRQAIETYGVQAQCDVAIEEMAELTKAIMKIRRVADDYGKTQAALENLLEEIADVDIMIDQMKIMWGPKQVEEYRRKKLERLERRMEEQHG